MTVGELKQELDKYNDSLPVTVIDYRVLVKQKIVFVGARSLFNSLSAEFDPVEVFLNVTDGDD